MSRSRSAGRFSPALPPQWGIPKDSAAGRRVFEERMEWRRGEDLRGEFKRVERGWCLGGEELLQDHPPLGLDRRALEPGQPRAFGPKRHRAGALQDAGALFDAKGQDLEAVRRKINGQQSVRWW